jgi:hypothetical protein
VGTSSIVVVPGVVVMDSEMNEDLVVEASGSIAVLLDKLVAIIVSLVGY